MRRRGIGLALLLAAAAACQRDVTGPGGATTVPETPATVPATLQVQGAGVAGSATGSAHLPVFAPPVPPGIALRNFAFTAVQAADGSVTGQWQLVAGSAILHGPIDCLAIASDGKSARISGLVESAKFTLFEEGTAFAMELFDNGAGASGEPDVSTQLRAFRNAAPEVGRAFCENGTIPAGADLDPLPTEDGNFTIRRLD